MTNASVTRRHTTNSSPAVWLGLAPAGERRSLVARGRHFGEQGGGQGPGPMSAVSGGHSEPVVKVNEINKIQNTLLARMDVLPGRIDRPVAMVWPAGASVNARAVS